MPSLNLVCKVWSFGTFVDQAPRLVDVPCSLYFNIGGSLQREGSSGSSHERVLESIFFAPGTDIRPASLQSVGWTAGDVIECPQGAGRYYIVLQVEDARRGTPSEFRIAVVAQTNPVTSLGARVNWPVPLP